MRRTFLALIALYLLIPGTPDAMAYGYAESEDEMVIIFKNGVVAAKKSEWDVVRAAYAKGISMQKGHMFNADELAPAFEDAVDRKDVSKTAGLFANLVYIAIREKLHSNSRENFKDYRNAKSRLGLARKSYVDVLDGNIKKQDATKSETILKQFDLALETIGNPGLFGIGAKPADPAKYQKAVAAIEKLIMTSFPGFHGGKTR